MAAVNHVLGACSFGIDRDHRLIASPRGFWCDAAVIRELTPFSNSERRRSDEMTGRLWIRVDSGGGERAADRLSVSGGPICPADDAFIERVAALKNS